MVAPGMSCKYMVRFAPDSLGDYEDCLVVETQAPYPMVLPLVARRPLPILTCESLPSSQSGTYCWVYSPNRAAVH